MLVAKTEDIIDSSMMEIRDMSHQLMPKGLSSEGLVVSLSKYCENLREVYNIPVQFNHNITASLHKDVQLNVYRIMCELVLNAVKHGDASQISVSIETPDGAIVSMVEDNGRGFDPLQINDSSLGLKSIQSRVDYLKGTMQIETAAGKGAIVKIMIPEKND
jgi:signal transduction histidine kinase